MFNKPDFSKIAKKIFRHKKGIRDHQIIHPRRDWSIGLLLAIIVFVIFGWWNINTYISYSNTSITGSVVLDDEVIIYREGQVEEVLSQYALRQERFDELLKQNQGSISQISAPQENEASDEKTTEPGVDAEDDDNETVLEDENIIIATSTATTSQPVTSDIENFSGEVSEELELFSE